MKKLQSFLFQVLLLGLFFNSNAQNPYQEYGVTPDVITLSDGKYNEFYDTDSLVEIGSVVLNTRTNKVVGFIETDTLYSEATLKPEIISRWLSPDPLADEFPDWSPYNFSYNSPITFTDPDGQHPIIFFALAVAAYVLDAGFAEAPSADRRPEVLAYQQQTRVKLQTANGVLTTVVNPGNTVNKISQKLAVKTLKEVNRQLKPKPAVVIEKPYKRPEHATTPQQRKSVQDKPCVDCGKEDGKKFADHKKPLVEEYYETGTIDKKKMREVEAVQPQCPTCSGQQGAELKKYSQEQKKKHGL